MGRNTKVLGAAPTEKGNVHTCYMAPSKWEILGLVAKAQSTTISELIRKATEPLIADYQNGVIPKIDFDLDGKYSERDKWKSLEDKMFKVLENTKSATRLPTFKVLCQFVTQFGVDKQLTDGLDVALSKLWLYKYNGNEPFAESTLFDFIRYLEAVMNRRRVEAEIWGYQKQKQQQDPLEACHV
jgi:hypothetical protein